MKNLTRKTVLVRAKIVIGSFKFTWICCTLWD